MTSENVNDDIYQQALADSIHVSLKTINSNIAKGGIRIAQEQALDLPYISVRTLLNDNISIPTDYQANAGKTATIFKVVKAAQLDEDLSNVDDEFRQRVVTLKPHLKTAFSQHFSAGLEQVDVRMRQLLIPKDTQYLSISPLTAAGLNLLLNVEVDSLKEQLKSEGKDTKLKNIQTAVFGIGGSNPQNVGSLVRAMQRPIVMNAPKLDQNERLAFQYFYKGFEYKVSNIFLNRELYQELTTHALALVQQQKLSYNLGFDDLGISAPFSNLKTRTAELLMLQKTVNNVLEQGQQIFRILKMIENQLPNLKTLERPSFWSHPQINELTQGLINSELQQDNIWKKAFADDLALKITRHHFWNKMIQQEQSSPLSEIDAKAFLSGRILELLK